MRPMPGLYVHRIGKCIFWLSGGPCGSREIEVGESLAIEADEEWTKRVNRGTTASPQQSYHPHSVRPHDGPTLWGLECLQANLC